MFGCCLELKASDRRELFVRVVRVVKATTGRALCELVLTRDQADAWASVNVLSLRTLLLYADILPRLAVS
jgi:hypothetical protein